MGSGASRHALLQRSGSRIDALLAEARENADNDDERLLGVTLARIPPGMRAESLQRPSTERARPYVEHWCHDTTVELPAAAADGVADEKSGRDGEAEEEEEGYSTDDFEDDEVTEWKKGASIGAGSYGTVYLARDEDTGCLMAVKEILISEETDSAIREATREVELLRSLKHENIVKYLGCHVDNVAQTLSIFTEWVPGGSLEHNRKLFGGNERVVRRFTHQLLSGVAYLHTKNIIHHDIKVKYSNPRTNLR
ncbi:STE/STE11 protein kinase [Phytophthora cinnamomi]|uniref:STE/STE11 protein kinase n=1 Tax=Phytophthora cinnamomi TaxID=4785 RepID=UPI003559BEF5|nr:STE/STE11 protein kinase [Phytophthora cinnamomi]